VLVYLDDCDHLSAKRGASSSLSRTEKKFFRADANAAQKVTTLLRLSL
jgi:hypothetical protein